MGFDWYSTESTEYRLGLSSNDPYTRFGYETGPLADVGLVHFYDQRHIEELLERFVILSLDYHAKSRMIPEESYVESTWNVVAQRPR